MFYRIATTIFCFILFIACRTGTTTALKETAGPDTLAISKYLNKKQPDSAFYIAEKQLAGLKNKDNPAQYIRYNQWLAEKFTNLGDQWDLVKHFCKNIFTTENADDRDSVTYAAITNAYFKWADISIAQKIFSDSNIICFEKAVTRNHRAPVIGKRDLAFAYKTIAVEYTKWGDNTKALYYLNLQKEQIEPGNSKGLASYAINKSIALNETGQTDSAIAELNRALPLKNVEVIKKSNILTNLAYGQTEKGQLIEAKRNILLAIQLLDTINAPTDEANERFAQAFKQKGIVEEKNDQLKNAIQSHLEALRYYGKIDNNFPRDIAKIYLELGKCYEKLQLPDSAQKWYHAALHKVSPVSISDFSSLPLTSSLYAENTIMEALDAKAGLFIQQFIFTNNKQYLETAVRCYALAFEVERKLMFNFSYDESKLQMLKVSRSRSRKAIDLCYRLFQLTGNEIWKEQAFQFAEKNKSFILLESIKRNIAANTGLKEDTLYQAVQLLQARLAHTDKLIFEAGAVKKDSLVLVYKTEKNKLANQLLLANNELTRSNSSFKELAGSEDSISFSIIQKKIIADNTALIEFFTGDSSNYIFIVTANSAPQFIKATDSLSQSTNNFLFFFTDKNNINNDPAAYQAAALRLYQQTGLARLQQTNLARLIIIPDGRLGFVPFEALVTAITPVQNPAKFSYLLRLYDISYGYSVSTLLKQNENPSISSGRLVCFAPAFTGNERGNATLVHSLEEAAAIEKENTGGEFYLKDKATLDQFRKSIAGAGIIHIATHANAFTTGNTQPVIQLYDSSLYLNEIYTLHCNPRLVVLSACETGIGVLDQSEGALSLARGFYYAGAKNIITSLWSVDDESTARIFKQFYSYSGNNYTASLSLAKRNYLDNASVSDASPYYWAAFIHLGCQQAPEKRNTTIPWLVAIICLIVITIFLAFRRK